MENANFSDKVCVFIGLLRRFASRRTIGRSRICGAMTYNNNHLEE